MEILDVLSHGWSYEGGNAIHAVADTVENVRSLQRPLAIVIVQLRGVALDVLQMLRSIVGFGDVLGVGDRIAVYDNVVVGVELAGVLRGDVCVTIKCLGVN